MLFCISGGASAMQKERAHLHGSRLLRIFASVLFLGGTNERFGFQQISICVAAFGLDWGRLWADYGYIVNEN